MIHSFYMDFEKTDNRRMISGDTEALRRYEGWEECVQAVSEQLGFEVKKVARITKGGNNGVFVFENREGKKIVAKFYLRDARNRLGREWHACTFLRKEGIAVPTPLICDEEKNFGVYSFEEGRHVRADDASKEDAFAFVDALCRLQSLRPENIGEEFPNGVTFAFCSDDVLNNVRERFDALRQTVEDGTLHPRVLRELERSNMLDEIEDLVKRSIEESSVSSWSVSLEDRRLSPVDIGFHNALFRDSKPPCLVDLEYFGWDDPLHSFADFLTHDQAQGLSEELHQEIIERYIEQTNLSESEQERLQLLIRLCDIKFIAIYLTSMTPRYLSTRSFAAAGEFDEEKYIDGQWEKIGKRMEKIKA